MLTKTRAGNVSELRKDSGDWIFVDIGFSATRPSCGVAKNSEGPQSFTFGKTVDYLKAEVAIGSRPLNLMIEAPLSVAFADNGNPVGRHTDKRGSQVRYWYMQSGTLTMVAATSLLGELLKCESRREVRLFEGFASFKSPGYRTSHEDDVERLRRAAWNPENHCVVRPPKLKVSESDTLRFAVQFADMDNEIPPVVFACDHVLGDPNCLL